MFIFHENNPWFMPLSGIFFVSLHHQSNRKIMFRKTDPNPQLDMFTAPSMQLGSRGSKKYSDPNAWHNQFYSLVTTKIDEEIFKPLFPEGRKSGQRSTWKRIPPRPFTALTLIRFRAILPELVICSNTVFIHVMARPDTGACSNIVCMHIADVCGWTSEGW